MPFGQSDVFEVPPLPNGWGNPFTAAKPLTDIKPSYHNDVDKKKQFGLELAKRNNQINSAFNAACVVFGNDTNAALWVSREWVTDPLVLETREYHLKTLEENKQSLDRDAFAARLLELSEAKNISGTHYIYDDKERVNLLKLYAEVRGFTGKQDLPTINNNNFVGLTLKLVKPEPKEIVEITPNKNPEIPNANVSPIKLKLVG